MTLPTIEPTRTSMSVAAKASDLGVERSRRRVACRERIAKGSGMKTEAMTRSENPSFGPTSGREAICSASSRSARSCSRQTSQFTRCSLHSALVIPLRQASNSSGERCCPEGRVISGPSYVEGEGKVSFLEVRQRVPKLVSRSVDVGLDGAQRQVEDLGDLLVGPALHVPQENAGAVLGSKRSNGGFDRAPQLFRLDCLQRGLLPGADLE